MRCLRTALVLTAGLGIACAGNPDRRTLAALHDVEPDLTEMRVDNDLEQAMQSYRKFLEEAPESALTPEAMRRLADLKLERQYGIRGNAALAEPGSPPVIPPQVERDTRRTVDGQASDLSGPLESDQEFERRTTSQASVAPALVGAEADLALELDAAATGPLEAIALYDQILAEYPGYPHNDRVLYQKARAFDELGRPDDAIAVIEDLIDEFPLSRYIDEAQFRRGEYFFTRRRFRDAERAYSEVVRVGAASDYYELALYKLGWALYKQDVHEEALDQFMALLDYKVSIGYDFEQSHDDADEQRIADTYRVISLSFSYIGGANAVADYFDVNGARSYEDRIYSQLGDFYLGKLRYHDAAGAYLAFVEHYPLHRVSPHFSKRVVEIYEAGGFPKLVLEARKEFAARYELHSEFWRRFDVEDFPEVISYLKGNLADLAHHYHALYQEEGLADDRPVNFREASRWYRLYLASFPEAVEAPAIHYQLADLLLEHEDFREAAREYERTAYEYASHDKAAAAGYAAIFAHREHYKLARGVEQQGARREAVESTFKFVDVFPTHEHAAVVMGSAVGDLYDMKEFDRAISRSQELIDRYPTADAAIRRSAWTVIAHSSIDLANYEQAERAYVRVLEMTPEADDSRASVADNLAAAIYEQGEQARLAGDDRAAAAHFLRIKQAAPDSSIRPAAEYDAGSALIRLGQLAEAAEVLDAFRRAYPDHTLQREATVQIASVYREQGEAARAAEEYERVADEAEDDELQGEALLLAGELYEEDEADDRALEVYRRYVSRFPKPLERAIETRFKIAEISRSANDDAGYREELRAIIEADAAAGGERAPRIRYLAAQAALVLTQDLYARFEEVRLVQPFEENLEEKQRRMDAAVAAFGGLVDYEVGEVTAAATFYMGEVYSNFSRSLLESERPSDLDAAELQDYELVLEEEAFPFEERAIEIHEKNLELMAAGIYNAWIERSLEALARLMPGRYAKFELSTGYLESIDNYAYRAPLVGTPALDGAESPEAAPASPAALGVSDAGPR